MVDDVRAQRVVASHLPGDEDLRADTVDGRGEDGIFVPGAGVEGGGAAGRAEDVGAVGLLDGGAHEIYGPLSALDGAPRGFVATPLLSQRRASRRGLPRAGPRRGRDSAPRFSRARRVPRR